MLKRLREEVTSISAKRLAGALFVTAFAAVGAYVLFSAHAATFEAASEAEAGTLTSPAASVADSSASGGHAVEFGTAGSSGSPTDATCPSPTPIASITGYTVTNCDDFNSGFGDFGPYNGGGSGTVVGAGRAPSQCSVSNGYLHLIQSSNGATCGGSMLDYTQRYGYWEVRMRAYSTSSSGGSAPHPVLILWPDTSTKTSEIDFFETDIGTPAHGYLHCISNPSSNCYTIPDSAVDYSQWHVYGFQWTPTSMTGYIDGTKWWNLSNISTVNPTSSSHQTIQLDNLSGSTPVKAGEMDIDWAHMYTAN